MKKLQLSALGLETSEILSREQMKRVQGGNWTCQTHADCPSGQACVAYSDSFKVCYTSKEISQLEPIPA